MSNEKYIFTKKGSTKFSLSSAYELETPTFDKNISCVVLYLPTLISLLTMKFVILNELEYSLYLLLCLL